MLHTLSITNKKVSLVDGTAMNWSEESAPEKTSYNIMILLNPDNKLNLNYGRDY